MSDTDTKIKLTNLPKDITPMN